MAASLLSFYISTLMEPSHRTLDHSCRPGEDLHTHTHPLRVGALWEDPQVFGLLLIHSFHPCGDRVLMASQVRRVSKERLARKEMLARRVLRAPLELLGLRWVVLSPPPRPRNCFHRAGIAGCRVRGGRADSGGEAWGTCRARGCAVEELVLADKGSSSCTGFRCLGCGVCGRSARGRTQCRLCP